jgi:hypothetical protein
VRLLRAARRGGPLDAGVAHRAQDGGGAGWRRQTSSCARCYAWLQSRGSSWRPLRGRRLGSRRRRPTSRARRTCRRRSSTPTCRRSSRSTPAGAAGRGTGRARRGGRRAGTGPGRRGGAAAGEPAGGAAAPNPSPTHLPQLLRKVFTHAGCGCCCSV